MSLAYSHRLEYFRNIPCPSFQTMLAIMIESGDYMLAPSISIGPALDEMKLEAIWRMMDDPASTTREDVGVALFGRRGRGDYRYGSARRAHLLSLEEGAGAAAMDPLFADADEDDAEITVAIDGAIASAASSEPAYTIDRHGIDERTMNGFIPVDHITPFDKPSFQGRRQHPGLSSPVRRFLDRRTALNIDRHDSDEECETDESDEETTELLGPVASLFASAGADPPPALGFTPFDRAAASSGSSSFSGRYY